MDNKKGVLCRIEEPENMPVDEDGNVADIISGPDSIPGRMNLGRLYAPYFNAAARDVRRQILEEMGYSRHHAAEIGLEELLSIDEPKYRKGVETLLRFYNITSPRTFKEFTETLTNEEREQWMLTVLNKAIYNYIPIEDDGMSDGDNLPKKFLDEKVEALEKTFKITYGPVTYVGRSGKKVQTVNKFRIAPLYFMLLDKIADTWLAADIGKHNNFGILAAMNEDDKFSTPWRRTPPRTIGETEGRLYCMYGGRAMIAEMMDRSGNLETQKEIAKTILEAEHPSKIKKLIDRDKIPFGNARPNQILHHIFRCMGFDVVFKPEK